MKQNGENEPKILKHLQKSQKESQNQSSSRKEDSVEMKKESSPDQPKVLIMKDAKMSESERIPAAKQTKVENKQESSGSGRFIGGKSIDMLHGTIWDKMILFALPLAFSSILQQLFNAADIAVVGRFAGQVALAAVGANAPVINLFVNLFVGLSVGANAVLSRYIGQKKYTWLNRGVHTTIVLAFLGGLLVMSLGVVCARPLLELLAAPEDILDLAGQYLRIYFLGIPFVMLYNFSAAILRSKGDTKRPLLALSIAGVLNVLLNLVFVIGLHLSVVGVALATALSNVVSSSMLLYFLMHEEGALKLELSKLKLDRKIFKRIARIGVPAGLQGMIFSLSNVIIQSSINRMGSLYVAANTAAINYEYVAFFIFNAFNSAALTFISQNYAVGNYERSRRCGLWAFGLAQAAGFIVNTLFILTRNSTIQLFTTAPEVIAIASTRVVLLLSFEFFNGSIELLSGILRGYGRSMAPAITAVLGICGVRILFVMFLPDTPHAYQILISAFPVSWLITSSALLVQYWNVSRQMRKESLEFAAAKA